MSTSPWPWSPEEAAEWGKELQQEKFGWMEELVGDMVDGGGTTAYYDPLQAQDEFAEEEAVAG